MVMISLSASPAWGPRFLAGWASWLSSRASQCGPKAWQKSSNWQKSSTSRSNMDASPHLMAPTQEEEFKGDKRLASPQTRNSGYYHAHVAVGDMTPETIHRQQCRTVGFLARKLIDDLENPTKILVFRQNEPVSAGDLIDLRIALSAYG